MVIKGNTRGNGSQLGQYLLTIKDNDHIHVMEVAGRHYASEAYLHEVIYGMELNSELTKSVKGLYHAQINPSEAESKDMTPQDWLKAADILEKELGFQNQTRILVLHEKKGRIHAHVVWDRYDVEKGVMKTVSFSRLAQDRARLEMERVFNHQPTPRRNAHRPEMKAELSSLWDKTTTGAEFVKEAKQSGYWIAEGSMRKTFTVIDSQGRSFDLVRQLKGVRIKEVRERLRHETLTTEKRAIKLARAKQNSGSGQSQQSQASFKQKLKADATAKDFAQSRNDATTDTSANKQQRKEQKAKDIKAEFNQSAQETTSPKEQQQDQQRKEKIAKEFAQSRNDSTIKSDKNPTSQQKEKEQKIENEFSENKQEEPKETDRERRYRELMEQMKEMRERDNGLDYEIE